MSARIRDHVRSNVVGYISLFLILSAGTAYATHETILSSDIVDGQVKSVDLRDDEVRAIDVRDDDLTGGGLTVADLRAGSVRSSEVQNGSIQRGDLAPAARSVRAYAAVHPANCTGTPGTCLFGQSKGISGVARVGTGQYCVTAPGIEANQTSAAVTVDFNATSTGQDPSAMTSEGSGCGSSGEGFRVITQRQGAGAADLSDTVGFTIVIP